MADSANPRWSMVGRLRVATGVSIYLAQRLLRQVEKLGAHLYKDIAVKFLHSCDSSREWLQLSISRPKFFGRVRNLIPKTVGAYLIWRAQNQAHQAGPTFGGEPR